MDSALMLCNSLMHTALAEVRRTPAALAGLLNHGPLVLQSDSFPVLDSDQRDVEGVLRRRSIE